MLFKHRDKSLGENGPNSFIANNVLLLAPRFGGCVYVFAAFEKLLQTFKELSLKVIHPWSNINYHHSYMLCCIFGSVKISRFIIHTGFGDLLDFLFITFFILQ